MGGGLDEIFMFMNNWNHSKIECPMGNQKFKLWRHSALQLFSSHLSATNLGMFNLQPDYLLILVAYSHKKIVQNK